MVVRPRLARAAAAHRRRAPAVHGHRAQPYRELEPVWQELVQALLERRPEGLAGWRNRSWTRIECFEASAIEQRLTGLLEGMRDGACCRSSRAMV